MGRFLGFGGGHGPRGRRAVSVLVLSLLATVVPLAAVPVAAAPDAAAATGTTVAVTPLPAGNARFVDAVYKDLLGRPSDAGGRAYWLGRMAKGLTRVALSGEVARSNEWRGRVVDRLFAAALGRKPTATERAARIAELGARKRVADIAAALYGSSAFWTSSGGTAAGFAGALFRSVVGRVPTSAEVAKVTADLGRGVSRVTVARGLFVSLEANGRRVDDLYGLLLGRKSESGGRAYWAQQLVTKDDIWLAGSLVGSPEYFNRAQGRIVSGSYVKPATTEMIASTSVTAISGGGTGPGSVTVPATVPAEVGDVVVVQPGAATGQGLIGRVTARTVNGAGKAVLSTTPAAWDEAFSEMDVAGIIDVPPKPAPLPDQADDAADGECGTSLSVVPSASITIDAELQWGPFKEDILRFAPRIQIGGQIQLATFAGLNCGYDIPFYTMWFQLGPLSLVLESSLDVGAGADGSLTGFVGASAFCTLGGEVRDGELTNLTGCGVDFTG